MAVLHYSCLLLLTLSAHNGLVHSDSLYVSYDEGTKSYKIQHGVDDWVARASFSDSINKTGWSNLEVQTSGAYDDYKQAYAAGLAEGHLTHDLIVLAWHNTMQGFCQPMSDYCHRLVKYIKQNAAWVESQIKDHASTVPYWHQVDLFYAQLNGLRDGFRQVPRSGRQPIVGDPLDMFLLMQIGGDLEDLESALKDNQKHKILGSGSCSALIKLLPGNKDLFVAQDTWSGFNSMLRILKRYNFQFRTIPKTDSAMIAGQDMTFSSYPGSLTSGDDFYTISSGLVSLETTIGNGNNSLWKYVHPEGSVLEGVRSMVANRLATSGSEWSKLFSQFNSGTYNNQWMVVDYKRFVKGHPKLSPGLLYIVEQIPGMIIGNDQTEILQKQSYWPSYNIAFYPEIFKASGNEVMVKKFGPWFSYDKSPRALIFKRDHVKVKDIKSMTALMRYNDYTHDPLSRCNCTPPYSGENAISARSDLNPANGTYPFSALGHRSHGGMDMKLTTSDLVKSLDFVAVGGPTYDQVPPFQWSKADFGKTTPHLGHPDLWMFKPIKTKWYFN